MIEKKNVVEVSMEAIHQVVNGRVLNRIIKLPKAMQNVDVEVTIKPVEKKSNPKITRSELLAMLKGSHTESLTGIIKTNKDISLEEYQAERRAKYECSN